MVVLELCQAFSFGQTNQIYYIYLQDYDNLELVEKILLISIGSLLLICDYFILRVFLSDPGIIPARLWGNILPARYKSINDKEQRIHYNMLIRGQLMDLQELLIAILATIVYYDLITIVYGLVHVQGTETIVYGVYINTVNISHLPAVQKFNHLGAIEEFIQEFICFPFFIRTLQKEIQIIHNLPFNAYDRGQNR
eukprot:403333350